MSDDKRRKIRQLTGAADLGVLEDSYSFLPPKSAQSWQNRMVQHYHSHLYKEFVLADLTRPGQIGLRWRTQEEVKCGKGSTTCGNKHCPSYLTDDLLEEGNALLEKYLARIASPENEEEELKRLKEISHGLGLCDYEVPFAYQERGIAKTELVKLRLCLRCAPLLFRKKVPFDCALEARRSREKASLANDHVQSGTDHKGFCDSKDNRKRSNSTHVDKEPRRYKKQSRRNNL